MQGGKIKDYFGRNRKVLYMILGIVLLSVFSLTVVYAALSTVLNINASAEVVASTWDIHLSNPRVTSGSATTDVPQIKTSSTLEFSTTLNMPGDFYEFTIDVVNDGSIDAMIDGITKTPTLTDTQAKYLNYIIEYQNGESINTKQLVSKNSFVRLKVRAEFRKDITASDLPTTSETLNLSFTVNYIQSDDTGSSVTDNGIYLNPVKVISGDGTQVGNEVCIGEECFYVISSDTDSVTMLSKMNITLEDNPIQSSSAGTKVFSSSTQKGTNYSDYNGSISEGYVNNYNSYLIKQGVTPIEARLITKDELTSEDIGCSKDDNSCSNAPSWINSTFYWTGSANGTNHVWCIYNDSITSFFYGNYAPCGVRPVITIDKSLL